MSERQSDNFFRRGMREMPSSVDEFLKLGTTHPRLLIPVLEKRPGQCLFGVKLEFEHYRPGSAKNGDFQVMRMSWMEERWNVFSIPRADRLTADTVAKQTGTRLANGEPHVQQTGTRLANGEPHVQQTGLVVAFVSMRHPNGEKRGFKPFPIRGPHVFALENDHKHPDWKARDTHPREAIEAEIQIVTLIMQRHYDTLPFELADALDVFGKPQWIKCRTCEKTSYNANDVAARYCGFCHKYHLPLPEGTGSV